MRSSRYLLTLLMGLAPLSASGAQDHVRTLSLDQAIEVALENNRYRPISRLGVEIAEAQYSQAMSSYWPQISVQSAFARLDDDPTTIFPEETSVYRVNDILPQPVEASITVPEKHIKLMDKMHFYTSGDLVYPLYTGGMRRGLRQQAAAGVDAARQEVRKTDMKVVYDVKRMYYGGVLARKLVALGEEALARLEVTLELTENLYKRGSGTVKKTDYLKHKVVVESIRSIVAYLRTNEALAKAALVNTMGLPWDQAIVLTEEDLPYRPYDGDLRDLVGSTYRFSPDWARLKAGLSAAGGRLKEARSGRMPRLALMGNLKVVANSYDAGIVGPEQKKSWRIGVGLEVPVFNGFLTRNRIAEAGARLEALKQQKVLLREGLALKVKYLFLTMERAQDQEASAKAALEAARDNRRLNVRAYQDDLVEVQDVVEAQLMESFVKARYLKVLYDHIEARSQLELVVGREVDRVVTEG